jgi:hypothetical protein
VISPNVAYALTASRMGNIKSVFSSAGEHTHRPWLGAITGGMDAARKWVAARQAQIALVFEVSHVGGRVKPLHRRAGDGREGITAFGDTRGGASDVGRLPPSDGFANVLDCGFLRTSGTSLRVSAIRSAEFSVQRFRITGCPLAAGVTQDEIGLSNRELLRLHRVPRVTLGMRALQLKDLLAL